MHTHECVLLCHGLDMLPLYAEIKRILTGKHHLIQVMVKSGLGRAHLKKMKKNEMKWIHLHAKTLMAVIVKLRKSNLAQ